MAQTARRYAQHQTHYLRKRVVYSDAAATTGMTVGVLPTGATVHTTRVLTSTAFNGTVSVALSVGYTATGTDLINGTDVRTAAARVDTVAPIAKALLASETTVYASLAFGGTTGSAGIADVIVEYSLPDQQ